MVVRVAVDAAMTNISHGDVSLTLIAWYRVIADDLLEEVFFFESIAREIVSVAKDRDHIFFMSHPIQKAV